jgi:PAS domain S-box-containing protein
MSNTRSATAAPALPAVEMFDAMPLMVAFVSTDLRYRFVNAAYERWFGQSRAELIGRSVTDLAGPQALDNVRGAVERALAGERATFEGEVRYASGPRHVRATWVPHRGDDGCVEGYAVFIEDIGDHVEAERLRRQHEQDAEASVQRAALLERVSRTLGSTLSFETTLHQLTEIVTAELADWAAVVVPGGADTLIPLAVSTTDPQYRARVADLRWRYAPRTGASRGVAEVIRRGRPELVPEVDEAFMKAVAVDEEQLAILREVQLLSYMAVPLAARGQVIGALMLATTARSGRHYDRAHLTQAQEIASRAALAIENARLYERVRAAEARLRLILESARDYAIFALDAEGRVVEWSEGARRIFGYEPEEMLGRDASFLFVPEDRAADAPARELATAREKGRAEDERWHVRKDGSRFFASGVVTPILDEEGAIRGYTKVAQDVTERKRGEDERQELLRLAEQARAAAEHANRMKDEFLALVSHELRTPLNAITGWAHVLEQGRVDAETARRAVSAIARNAAIQGRLIHDLLDMSRILAGQLRLDVQETELIPVIEGVLDTVRPAADAKGIHLERILDPRAEPILGDPTRMHQVLWNLLSNSIKFTPEGGRVEVRLERAGRNVRIVVADTGRGIDPDFLPFLFDRFRQGEPLSSGGRQSGLGLGLSLVRHLVELHGGTVVAESAGPGRGTVFTVTIPWWNPRSYDEAGLETDENPIADLHGMRVLLVEDDPDTRELVGLLLSRLGASVHAVSSGAEALAVLAEKPDVLVSDLHMPGFDGFELIRAVRRRAPEAGGRVPAIALSAFTRSEDRRKALDAGYQIHVPKPVTPAKLAAVIGFVVRQRPGPI